MRLYRTGFGIILLSLVLFFVMSCNGIQNRNLKQYESVKSATIPRSDFLNDTIFNSENLILVRLSPHVFQHISYLNTNDFGRVNCNGMVVINDNEAVIFDTPTNDESSEELINFLTQKLKSRIVAVIPTHFHDDCLGGIKAFYEHHIQAYAGRKTVAILKEQGNKDGDHISGFDDSLNLRVGDKIVVAKYFGEGHTKDNITGYFPADRILFGGCLIKELNATKGFLGDANIRDWPLTVAKLKREYSQAKIVIPGHGNPGGIDLLDYTEFLFK
jgi:metallo-beta-lactamase class B